MQNDSVLAVENNSCVKSEEELFLSSYNINNYDRPSIAADIVVLSTYGKKSESHRKDSEPMLSILLIKRGEHPYKNSWALPGGFLRADETIEECAYREIAEESGLIPVSLMPVGVFSKPDRDPRGRVVSNAFVSVISEDNVKVSGGYDAIDAKWFDVSFKFEEDKIFKLELTYGDEKIYAELKENETRFGSTDFEIISDTALAFDHAKIIATALSSLRSKAENLSVAFDFLPERFTLAALQRVQETLLGVSLLTANFRRKIAGFVEETDEYTEGVGHRPARLYKRKADKL